MFFILDHYCMIFNRRTWYEKKNQLWFWSGRTEPKHFKIRYLYNFVSEFGFFLLLRMGTRTATNALVKRTTFSSAINIFPNEVANSKATTAENINENDNVVKQSTQIRPYSEVPGPKGLPLIGNSWRFAPLIGKT